MGDSPFAAGALVCGDMYMGRLKIAQQTDHFLGPRHSKREGEGEKDVSRDRESQGLCVVYSIP